MELAELEATVVFKLFVLVVPVRTVSLVINHFPAVIASLVYKVTSPSFSFPMPELPHVVGAIRLAQCSESRGLLLLCSPKSTSSN